MVDALCSVETVDEEKGEKLSRYKMSSDPVRKVVEQLVELFLFAFISRIWIYIRRSHLDKVVRLVRGDVLRFHLLSDSRKRLQHLRMARHALSVSNLSGHLVDKYRYECIHREVLRPYLSTTEQLRVLDAYPA